MGWIIVALLAGLLGLAFHRFKLYELFIGYDKMDESQKEDACVQPISKYLAFNTYILAGIALAVAISRLLSWLEVYNALFILLVIVFFWSVMDVPRYIRLIKDESAQPIKMSSRHYLKLVRTLSSIGVLVAFFIYLLLR